MLSIAIFGSGKGSNAQCIMDAIETGTLNARIVCVFSDVTNATILERAKTQGIPAEYIDCAPFKTKLDGEAEQTVISKLKKYGADFIVLAGFMRMIKKGLIQKFPHRIINIHPALLPAFPGLESWKQAIEYGAKVAGCTVHFVDEGMDTGPIIVQKAVPIETGDTPETLHARIQKQEHIAYPEALRLIADDKIHIEGRRVVIKGN